MKSLSTATNLFSRNFYNSKKFFSLITIFNSFLLVALFTTILFANPKQSNADTVEARAGSSVYYASISNDNSVSIPVTPTATQTEYTATNKILFSNTCPAGSSVQLNTSSNNNALTRTGGDSGKKTIEAVAGSGLTENTWGFKREGSGNAFSQVPSADSTPAVIYSSTTSETNTEVNVVYGVKLDNTIPSGTYTNDVVYTVVVDNKCLQYTLKFDLNGGTGASGADYSNKSINYGDKIDLSSYTPTKSGYTFAGWSNGSSTFTDFSSPINVNPNNNMTLTLSAVWRDARTMFDITYMQDMSTVICENTTTPLTTAITTINSYSTDKNKVPRTTLIDSRDNKEYLISKLADGQCWMSQNLELDFYANTTSGYADDTALDTDLDRAKAVFTPSITTLTDDTTDLHSKKSWTPTYATQSVPTAIGKFYDLRWMSSDLKEPHSFNTAAAGLSKYVGFSGRTNSDGYYTQIAKGTGEGYERIGNYYNLMAATAGSAFSSDSGVAPDSICAKNWMLPNKDGTRSFVKLFDVYGLPLNMSREADWVKKAADFPLHFFSVGFYQIYDYWPTDNTLSSIAGLGRYWANTLVNTNTGATLKTAYNYYYLPPSSSESKPYGMSIRCVAR